MRRRKENEKNYWPATKLNRDALNHGFSNTIASLTNGES
jgi:hypothetical protein